MIATKLEAFKDILDQCSDALSNNGCNDFKVMNNPEMYALLEQQAADNLRCKSIEEFRNHPEYEDYKPNISSDKKYIYTQDYIILSIIKKDLGIK